MGDLQSSLVKISPKSTVDLERVSGLLFEVEEPYYRPIPVDANTIVVSSERHNGAISSPRLREDWER